MGSNDISQKTRQDKTKGGALAVRYSVLSLLLSCSRLASSPLQSNSKSQLPMRKSNRNLNHSGALVKALSFPFPFPFSVLFPASFASSGLHMHHCGIASVGKPDGLRRRRRSCFSFKRPPMFNSPHNVK